MIRTITEPAKEVPVAREVDVVVAGAGVSGVFAALGAAKAGALVLLTDRFGQIGGNMGPGLLNFGGAVVPPEKDQEEKECVRFESTIRGEFMVRCRDYMGPEPYQYPVMAHVMSQVAFEMMRETGVELMLSAYAGDPIMDRDAVCGLFVETKSGRVAVQSKVLIDATGDASTAERAGAKVTHFQPVVDMDYPSVGKMWGNPDYSYWNDGAVMYIASGVDLDRYNKWRWEIQEKDWESGDEEWYHAHFEDEWSKGQKALVPALHKYDRKGISILDRDIRERLHTSFPVNWTQIAPSVVTSVCNVSGEYDTGDWKDISLAEEYARMHAFDGMHFMRKNIPGFDDAQIIATAAFLGARGGPNVVGDHLLTIKEGFEGLRHPEVIFVSIVEVHRGADESGFDVPYGIILPKHVNGMLVTARGASFIRRGHEPSFRARGQMMNFGHATGLAATLAAREGVEPRDLDVKNLQQSLLAEGFYLGDEKRLAELGLA